MRFHALRYITVILLISCLTIHVPSASGQFVPASRSARHLVLTPPPVPTTPAGATDPQLAALTLAVSLAPDPIAQGDTATLRVTVQNLAPHAAHQVLIVARAPDGVVPATGPISSARTGWQWLLPALAGGETTMLTATLRLVRAVPGRALVVTVQATAATLALPVIAQGAALMMVRAIRGVRFTPGTASVLSSSDGSVSLRFPAAAFPRPLTLQAHALAEVAAARRAAGLPLPPALANGHRTLPPVVLEAADDDGNVVHAFNTSLAITLAYDPAYLDAIGLPLGSLTIFWFDEGADRWLPLPSTVDADAQTVTTFVPHLSIYTIGDGLSPSAAFVPSLQGFQGSSFTGAASYHLPLDVPAGAHGHAPRLDLSYTSAASDGTAGERRTAQASWVGKGWSLDPGGAIVLNKNPVGDGWNSYTLVVDGRTTTLTRGQPSGTRPDGAACTVADISFLECWSWHPVDDTFLRVQVRFAGNVTLGVAPNTVTYRTYTWHAWTPSGTRYDFGIDQRQLWWSADQATREVYTWLLVRSVDAFGNVVRYDYQIDAVPQVVNGVVADAHPSYAPLRVSWAYDGALIADVYGTVVRTGVPRYQVWFNNQTVVSRQTGVTAGVDTEWDYPSPNGSQTWRASTPHAVYRLDTVQVVSMPPNASSYQLVRQYNLSYASASTSLQTDDYTGQRQLTLTGVERLDQNGQTFQVPGAASPRPFLTSFTYATDPGPPSDTRPAGFNRLATIDNGQGGRISLSYEHVFVKGSSDPANAPPTSEWYLYRNYHRLAAVLVEDVGGSGKRTLTTYQYQRPAVNDEAHAATVLYAHYPPSGNGDSRAWLAQPEKHEFRGHAQVVMTLYDGGTISAPLLRQETTIFAQGDAGCTPVLVGGKVNEADACYQQLRDQEAWKGRVLEQRISAGGGAAPLQRMLYTYQRMVLPFYGDASSAVASNNYQRVGLWRAFVGVVRTDQQMLDSSGTAATRRTETFFNSACAVDGTTSVLASYGQARCVRTWDRNALVRTEVRMGTPRADAGGYVVDRVMQEALYDGAGRLVGLTNRFYDGATAALTAPTQGLLTRETRYVDVPSGSVLNIPLHGSDTTYGADGYGNVTTVTTYREMSTRLFNGSTTSWSSVGGASQTTLTSYDNPTTTFDEATFGRSYSVTQPPAMAGAVGLTEQVRYDERMGTLTSTIDANGAVTRASYDSFGRLVALTKPGDTSASVQAIFYDTERPFRYLVQQADTSADGVRLIVQVYSGLGDLLQTKAESSDGTSAFVSVVTETRTDALGRVTAAAQPRYQTETSASRVQWTNPGGGGLYRATLTSYDALGRVLTTQTPDGRMGTHHYGVTTDALLGVLVYDDITDANRHRTQMRSDALGRRRVVLELSGDCGNYWVGYACGGGTTTPWAIATTTSYAYDSRDLLTSVTDTAANVTSMIYDSLGRKTAMIDPDMGTWSYQYDPNGNLTRQTDARGQRICFFYDNLQRLLGTHLRADDACPSTPPAILDTSYGYDEGVNGLGHRTSMRSADAVNTWSYDVRGRVLRASSLVAGLTRTIAWGYDIADQPTTLTYPSGEVVTTSYDAGWRPTSLCSSLGVCYISGATANALNQPLVWDFGDGTRQIWGYDALSTRPAQLQVGVPSAPGGLLSRSYGYDAASNVTAIADSASTATSQTFDYDEQDRLTDWTINSVSQHYDYDGIGNLLTTPTRGTAIYGTQSTSCAAGAQRKPHAVVQSGAGSFCYDANGNLVSGGGRNITWGATNLPTSISQTSGSEGYGYDADGERVRTTRGSQTRVSFFGLLDEVLGGTTTTHYVFAGHVVAVRDSASGTVSMLHSDHLGSVTLATWRDATQGLHASEQQFDPWGKVRSGGLSQTDRNFTGQRLDGTGLLFYHARLYDPALGRFISADSVVPGEASGGLDGVALKPLTVDAHEPDMLRRLNVKNRSVDNSERDATGYLSSQSLNRYSYVLNNPLKYTDPTGHSVYMDHDEAEKYAHNLDAQAQAYEDAAIFLDTLGLKGGLVGSVFTVLEKMGKKIVKGGGYLIAISAEASLSAQVLREWMQQIRGYAEAVRQINGDGSGGIIISSESRHDAWGDFCIGGCQMTIVSNDTGNGVIYTLGYFPGRVLFEGPRIDPQKGLYDNPSIWEAGYACTQSGGTPSLKNYYKLDYATCGTVR